MRQGISKGLEVISQELVKGQTYLQNVQDLNKPDLLSQSFTAHVSKPFLIHRPWTGFDWGL